MVALVLAACGGEAPAVETKEAPAAAGSSASNPEPSGAAQPEAEAEAEAPRSAAAPTRSPSQVPTAADSAAALAEDVSPEWKMRSRQREPYSSCMEKTVNAPADIRPTLVAACGRLPDAPK
jgi:hypothetical protein